MSSVFFLYKKQTNKQINKQTDKITHCDLKHLCFKLTEVIQILGYVV